MLKSILPITLALFPVSTLAGPDLSDTVPILEETFRTDLNRYDGKSGLWTTLPRRQLLMTNAAETVFLDYGVLGAQADSDLPPVHAITRQGLALRSVVLPDQIKPTLNEYMAISGQGNHASKIKYATGMISTSDTWAQKYGYFEVEARIPQGKGRWPAFWLTFAGLGWPPEIDVFEAYGAGIEQRTKKDNTFNTAVHFDTFDADHRPTHGVNIKNPYAENGDDGAPHVKQRGLRDVYAFRETQNAAKYLDADIYNDFHTYAAMWTPESITFYFGKDRDSLAEIYRVPTPDDANDPMYLIANDQFTARGGWWSPRHNVLNQVLDPNNAFVLRSITMRALLPEAEIHMKKAMSPFDPGDSVIFDTRGDDVIIPGPGFDIINLSRGADRLYLTRGRQNKIIDGFGRNDQLILEGYPFNGPQDVMVRLTEVGDDVWLPSGADPAWPHTIIFRNANLRDFSAKQFTLRWPLGRDVLAAVAARKNSPETDKDADGVLTAVAAGSWLRDSGNPVVMHGGPGHDKFTVAHRFTQIFEAEDGGVDTLIAWTDFTLPDHVEHGIARAGGTHLRGSPGGDRLEAESVRNTLEGGDGDDLYVIQPTSKTVTVKIDLGRGHDRLRGFGSGHRLALTPALQASRVNWKVTERPSGVLIEFGPDQSLFIEGATRATTDPVLGLL